MEGGGEVIKSSKTLWRIVFVAMPPILLIMAILTFDFSVHFIESVNSCQFYRIFGRYCPACGNTRSVKALFHGDVLGSLRYNAFIIFLCLLGPAFYIENALHLFGIKIKLVPRSNVFLFVSLALLILYFILRNFFEYLTP